MLVLFLLYCIGGFACWFYLCCIALEGLQNSMISAAHRKFDGLRLLLLTCTFVGLCQPGWAHADNHCLGACIIFVNALPFVFRCLYHICKCTSICLPYLKEATLSKPWRNIRLPIFYQKVGTESGVCCQVPFGEPRRSSNRRLPGLLRLRFVFGGNKLILPPCSPRTPKTCAREIFNWWNTPAARCLSAERSLTQALSL